MMLMAIKFYLLRVLIINRLVYDNHHPTDGLDRLRKNRGEVLGFFFYADVNGADSTQEAVAFSALVTISSARLQSPLQISITILHQHRYHKLVALY